MFAQPTDSVKHLRKYKLWFLGQVERLVLMFGFSTFEIFSIIFYMTRQMLAVSAESEASACALRVESIFSPKCAQISNEWLCLIREKQM